MDKKKQAKKSTLFGLFFFMLFAATIAASASAYMPSSCAISPGLGYPLQPDTDCDGIVDRLDNCQFITNPSQYDADMNGLGDACDVYIESVRTNPSDFIYNNRGFEVVATILNNRDHNIRNAKVSVIIPDLGIESVQYISNLEECKEQSVEFTLRMPACGPAADYPVYVETTFTNIIGEQEKTGAVTTIRMLPDEQCANAMEAGSNGNLGNTYVDVMEIQDVYKGSEAVFPIKISNREGASKDYVISATGLSGWGSYRLTPSSLVIVPSGSERIADLYVSAQPDAAPGERVFVVTIKSGEEYQRFLLIANVKEQPVEDNSVFFIFGFRIIIAVLLLALIIWAIIAGFARYIAKAREDARREYY